MHKVLELFKTYGIKSQTMDDVAKVLGVSKRTLYKYIDSKNQIVEMALNSEREQHDEYKEKFLCKTMNEGLNSVEAFYHMTNLFIENYLNTSRVFISDLNTYYSEILESHQEKALERTKEILKNHFKRGIENGYYRKELDIDTAIILLLNSYVSIYETGLITIKKFRDNTFQKEFLKFTIMSFLTEKGHKELNLQMNKLL